MRLLPHLLQLLVVPSIARRVAMSLRSLPLSSHGIVPCVFWVCVQIPVFFSGHQLQGPPSASMTSS